MEHPFLICRKTDYPSLRDRATEAPWSSIISQARKLLAERQYDPQQSVTARGTQIRDIAGAAALLHLIEPDDDTNLQRIVGLLDAWPAYLEDIDRQWNAPGNRWLATVPPSSGFFNTVLALDLIHDGLSFADLDRHEKTLQAVADWFWEVDRGWAMATYGPRAIWAAYRDEARLLEALAQYRNAVFEQMTDDGVGRNGPEYSHARPNGERTAKYGFMHVAEHTGLDPVYYDSPQLARFYEWLFSAGCSPFNSYVTFADSGHGRSFASFYPQSGAWAAGRFSPLAAEYAAHRITSSAPPPPGDLLAYCIAQPLPTSRIPQSRIWSDGGALFYEQNDSQNALMGALWNVETPGHHHRDANAVYLAGYGEHLLLNSGYNGYGNDAEGFPWEYINDTAESSNTLTIGDHNHLCQGADGVTESLLTDRLDYVSARADRAFPRGVAHGNDIVDSALESSATTPVTVDATSFHGRAAVYRQNAENLDFYFVRQGRSFSSGSHRIGFESSDPLSIYMKGTKGRIISPGATVTLYHPALSRIQIDGWEITPEETGDGWARFPIPIGTHDVSLSG